MEAFTQAAAVLPGPLRRAVLALPEGERARMEELRLRLGQPPSAVLPEEERRLGGPVVTEEDLNHVVDLASQASLHRVMDQLCRGYLTLRGGHRLGLCGRAMVREGRICALREFSSADLRIARQKLGVARPVAAQLWKGSRPANTLILAPPGLGKTTLLRDLIRCFSAGDAVPARRVSVVDERGELAALWEGRPQLDLGPRTDVLEGCPKAEGMMLLLRAMNPQVLAVDEITSPADVEALEQGAGCGVSLLATAHGLNRADLERRSVYRPLLASGILERLVTIRREGAGRAFEVEVLD